jgi:hypothetical protein
MDISFGGWLNIQRRPGGLAMLRIVLRVGRAADSLYIF